LVVIRALRVDASVGWKGVTMTRKTKRVLLVTAVLALLLAPSAVVLGASGGFDDVSDDNVFRAGAP
jgi:hypothetical protein